MPPVIYKFLHITEYLIWNMLMFLLDCFGQMHLSLATKILRDREISNLLLVFSLSKSTFSFPFLEVFILSQEVCKLIHGMLSVCAEETIKQKGQWIHSDNYYTPNSNYCKWRGMSGKYGRGKNMEFVVSANSIESV